MTDRSNGNDLRVSQVFPSAATHPCPDPLATIETMQAGQSPTTFPMLFGANILFGSKSEDDSTKKEN